eukprot:TRINITY_DN23961_c0_g1_i1.p1 TRINITY_DN23961_c0_g1~~TRINITY_DN23961_c0_g1_i1.p1  ORF type:complete len:652 (-),score=90.61 TRINITY_DN23961_c0_g1_i1:123-2078(-)
MAHLGALGKDAIAPIAKRLQQERNTHKSEGIAVAEELTKMRARRQHLCAELSTCLAAKVVAEEKVTGVETGLQACKEAILRLEQQEAMNSAAVAHKDVQLSQLSQCEHMLEQHAQAVGKKELQVAEFQRETSRAKQIAQEAQKDALQLKLEAAQLRQELDALKVARDKDALEINNLTENTKKLASAASCERDDLNKQLASARKRIVELENATNDLDKCRKDLDKCRSELEAKLQQPTKCVVKDFAQQTICSQAEVSIPCAANVRTSVGASPIIVVARETDNKSPAIASPHRVKQEFDLRIAKTRESELAEKATGKAGQEQQVVGGNQQKSPDGPLGRNDEKRRDSKIESVSELASSALAKEATHKDRSEACIAERPEWTPSKRKLEGCAARDIVVDPVPTPREAERRVQPAHLNVSHPSAPSNRPAEPCRVPGAAACGASDQQGNKRPRLEGDIKMSQGRRCYDCGEMKPTFLDSRDNMHYCQECWVSFYGQQPGAYRDTRSLLPDDAPRGHIAHTRVRYNGTHANPLVCFVFKQSGQNVCFQTTVAAAGSRHAAEVIARACWLKFAEGWTKPDVIAFRNQCYARLKQPFAGMLSHMRATPQTPGHTLQNVPKPELQPQVQMLPRAIVSPASKDRSQQENCQPPSHARAPA